MFIKSFSFKIILLLFASFLFSISSSVTSWIVYVPVLVLVHNVSLRFSWIWGGIYGFLSYLFYATWLVSFSVPASIGVFFLYFLILSLLFLLLKLADLNCKKSYLVQWILLCAFEYLKTTGFLGFSYGVTAYSHWKNIFFIQCCDIFGVFGLNSVILFFSAYVYKIILQFNDNKISIRNILHYIFHDKVFYFFILTLFVIYVYGFISLCKKSNVETINVAAIQNNSDPWKIGFNTYKDEVETLIELTDSVLNKYPDVELVVWPETAVIPSIIKNYYNSSDIKRKELITELLEYFNSKDCGFVVGNYHVEQNGLDSHDFNSAFLFIPKENVLPPNPLIYSKVHLVPITEYFPYENIFPNLYKILLAGDTHLWTPGSEYSVFKYKNLNFSTPICFEDTFGNDCRQFVKNGARAFINLSNDAWSKSKRCQNQHLSMAVFRSVENKVPSVRSSASGMTCIIDRFGRITEISEPFQENYVYGKIEFSNDLVTVYSKIGDVVGILFVILATILVAKIFLELAFRRNFNNRRDSSI